MRSTPALALALAAGLAAVGALGFGSPAAAAPAQGPARNGLGTGEEFHYRWKLGSLMGKVAGLFLPDQGDGVLSFTPEAGRLRSELVITSEQGKEGEYWRYGSMVDLEKLEALRAWSSYRWKGKEKSKSAEIDQAGVQDIASWIYALRRDPPTAPRQLDIWSDGRTYPVVVIPRGRERRQIAGREIATRRFSVRGYDGGGGQRRFKGRLELWLAEDAAATPVEIRIERNLADLRLELTSLP